ncbi:MAG: glycogen synthase GlgA [Pseudomonadota bacterium]
MSRILFATSEAAPLIKTGGLADISASLPAALKRARQAVRLVLPAYPQALQRLGKSRAVAQLEIDHHPVTLYEGRMPDSGVIVWLVDSPAHFQRDGGPYSDSEGNDWPDNAERFALFSRTVAAIAMDRAGLKWQPEVVHCNDWQTGLVPALLHFEAQRPATLFSIHNLAYQGRFPYETFQRLRLPEALWDFTGLEFYGGMSMIKGGLAYADRLTTVSPTYAEEITTPALGNGLDGLLRHRRERLTGILNGVDYQSWDPAHDPLIDTPYSASAPEGKAQNKAALQRRLGLPQQPQTPLLGLVSRFVEQKGIDLVVAAADALLEQPLQLVMLGSGDKQLEQQVRELARRYPQQVAVEIGYDEALSHQIEAGADLFLMPSRFEPCGLNQLYSLRYGTLPVVRRTGGLADTVVHTTPQSLADGSATGFSFDHASTDGLLGAVAEALACYHNDDCRQRVMQNAMQCDFSWRASAREYLNVYRQAMQDAASS